LVYDLSVNFDSDSVSNWLNNGGERPGLDSPQDLLINNSDTVQIVDYTFTARIRDDRLGHSNEYCDNGSVEDIRILLNPTPRLRYTLDEDTLCFDDGFNLGIDSLVYATNPLFYSYTVNKDDVLTGIPSPGDSIAVAKGFGDENVENTGKNVGRVVYKFVPFISEEGCFGDTTEFLIDVNPKPALSSELFARADSAVCYGEGYQIALNTDIEGTTGLLQYSLNTSGHTNTVNVQPIGDWDIDNIDESDVINMGDSIEEVSYGIIPIIIDAKGNGRHCLGDPEEDITVIVTPELKSTPVAEDFIGGWEIRCNGDSSDYVHGNVGGGYYKLPYTFTWETLDGTPEVHCDRYTWMSGHLNHH